MGLFVPRVKDYLSRKRAQFIAMRETADGFNFLQGSRALFPRDHPMASPGPDPGPGPAWATWRYSTIPKRSHPGYATTPTDGDVSGPGRKGERCPEFST